MSDLSMDQQQIINDFIDRLEKTSADPDARRELFAKIRNILARKGDDYSFAGEHPWTAFEDNAFISDQKPEIVFRVIVGLKIIRSMRLIFKELAGKEPSNESVDNTMLDLVNYLILFLTYVQATRGLKE